MTGKEIREKRLPLSKRMRELTDKIHAENRDFTAEEKANWEQLNTDYDLLTRQIEVAERTEKVEADQIVTPPAGQAPGRSDTDRTPPAQRADAGAATEEHRALVLQAWFRSQVGEDITEEQTAACQLLRFNPSRRELVMRLGDTRYLRSRQAAFVNEPQSMQQRALSALDGSAGGNMVPETMIGRLEVQMLAFGGMLQVAEIIRTAGGEPMGWPTANDTGNSGRQLGESAAVTSTDEPTFGRLMWNAYTFTSDEILVPTSLLQDSAFDLAGVLGDMLGERLGRIQNNKYTLGVGNATPRGIVTAAALGVTSDAAAAISADEFIELEHSVDPAYRVGAGYMFHDNTLMHARTLKDGQGRYLWQESFNSGVPDRLNSRPYTINQDMADTIEASAKTVLFGQISKYKIRQVREVRMYRLVERHRENDQDAFLAFIRADGNLVDVGSPVKYLIQTT
ncbi:MAG TPA: phage major capsid protein [Phycisphaerae bacterium]|nr:phage major capsid protein [Phycisphaerae bacterium]